MLNITVAKAKKVLPVSEVRNRKIIIMRMEHWTENQIVVKARPDCRNG
jgi:hypothetical protein